MLRICVACLVVACGRPAVQAPRVAPGAATERPITSRQTDRDAIRLATGADVAPPPNVEPARIEVTSAREPRQRAQADRFFADRQELVDAFVAWAQQDAIGDDLAGVARVIGDARVIALGEADHGVHEYLAYRNRLAKHLVEHAGVTAILVESGFTETTVADDYVTGAGSASSREAAAAVFSWAMPAALRDNVELVEWLRAYNATAARKVHIYGIDVTGGRHGRYTQSRLAADAALAYLAQHDPSAHARLESRLAPLLPRFDVAGYLQLDDAQRSELTSAIAELLAAFKSLPDSAELRRARQHAAMAAVLDTFFRQTRDRSTPKHLADAGLDGIRDATMAANVMWALGEEGDGSRVLLFAHNAHVRRGPVVAWPVQLPPSVTIGEYLANSLHGRLVVIGALHGDGPPTATLDGLFARVGRPSFLLDLRRAPEAVRAGLSQSWKFRLDAFRELGLEPVWSAIPTKCFDALVYTATSSEASLAR
ncbi:MAG TPA: erythromycin esterase family protein [Kofleriaceae bacterium]|nr:erythromycin esterase family protein [Kofleriaceae bacterium]